MNNSGNKMEFIYGVYRCYDDFSSGGIYPKMFTNDENKAKKKCRKLNKECERRISHREEVLDFVYDENDVPYIEDGYIIIKHKVE